MSAFLEVLLLSIGAGILGTLLGGIIAIFIGSKEQFNAYLLVFAGGVMLSVVFFDLIPETFELTELANANNVYSIIIVFASILLGAFFVILVSDGVNVKLVDKNKEINKMYSLGIIVVVAISLHNFPEGLAIGASRVSSFSGGLIMAILIALHNIPEGVAMGSVLKMGGTKTAKNLGLCALTGVPTVLGALLGFTLGNAYPLLAGVCLGVAGGSMIYIVFAELLPNAYKLKKSTLTNLILIGAILVGLLLVKTLN